MKLILIRHGETQFNAEHRLTGQIDVPLSSNGTKQALAVAERLASEHIDQLLSSPLERAYHTAEIIGQRHNKVPKVEAWLSERFCGALEGLTKNEMKAGFRDARIAYKNRQLNLPIEGGGETSLQFHTRVANGLAGLLVPWEGKTVLAVSHGGTIRETFNLVFNTSQNGNQLHCPNCSISVFHCSQGTWRMKTWGDTAHLQITDNIDLSV